MNDTHFAYVNALTVTHPLGNVTVNTYDDLNRLLSTTTTPSVGDDIVVSYAYDQVGNRTRQTDGRDCIVRFTYDGLNRLLTTVHDADTTLEAVETNLYNDLNKVSYEDAEGRVIEYAYDVRNRLTGETVPSRAQDTAPAPMTMWAISSPSATPGTPGGIPPRPMMPSIGS